MAFPNTNSSKSTMDSISDEAKKKSDQVGAALSGLKEEIKDKAAEMSDKASQFSDQVSDRASELSDKMSNQAHKMASDVSHKADDAISSVGAKLTEAGAAVRDHAPNEGMLAEPIKAVAANLESGGKYLSKHGAADIAEDMTSLVRKYPLQALGLGLAVGFLLGNARSSR